VAVYKRTETGITENSASPLTPRDFELRQNYPNPFNQGTSISFQIPMTKSQTHIILKIYNIMGQEIRTLVDESKGVGYYLIQWDGKDKQGNDVTSGVYFCRLIVDSGRSSEMKRMVLIR
jgi:flagellar hook assembly protein FlgD